MSPGVAGTVIAVDSGGTFSDCVVLDADGRVTIAKAPSTPGDFSAGVLASVQAAARLSGVERDELLRIAGVFGHGTTAATNALLTRTGERVGLLTTKGHEDALIVGRTIQKAAGLTTEELTNLAALEKAEPIVPRHLIRGVTERIDYKGAEIVALDLDEARGAVDEFVRAGVTAIAVCFLWSFMNPEHERVVLELIEREQPECSVTASHRVAPVIKEYERCATTILNAYLSGATDRHISALEERLANAGFRQAPLIMQSSGGVTSAAKAKGHAVRLIASGPAGGLVGAAAMGAVLGCPNIITTDVGGTSFDVGLIVDGQPLVNNRPVFDKYHTALPIADVASVGAGGGSIAWIELATNQLKVGPRSAGADPGPACYGHGVDPTVTDADVVLGRIDPASFLGGERPLDPDAAERAIRDRLCPKLGLSVQAVALGIVEIVDARMAELVRRETIGRGYDPREFALFAFGGAGPLHVGAYGFDVGAREVVVPAFASVFSAFGIAGADLVCVQQVSDPMLAPLDLGRLEQIYAGLRSAALAELEADGIGPGDADLQAEIEMRYRGQVHEVRVPIACRALTEDDVAETISEFEARYTRRYGRGTAHDRAAIEARTYIVRGTGRLGTPVLQLAPLGPEDPSAARIGERDVQFRALGGRARTAVYRWEQLAPGHRLRGPAIVEAVTTSAVVHPGQIARVDGLGNLRLTLEG